MAYGSVNVGGGGGGFSQDSLEEIRNAVTAVDASAKEAKATADTALAAANGAKNAADTALTTANALKEIFEQSGGGETGGEVTLAYYHIGTEPPENTKLLWIDTTEDGTGGLKYHTGSAWAAVPVAWG
ncbi:MAG: hypothetical protein HFF62_15915 [Oscillospiraceae bacterium]|nr:hypothetical protein [Oscillospiraceae bacterium]